MFARTVALSAIVLAAVPGQSFGQCQPRWQVMPGLQLDGTARCSVVWDEDGPGPLPARLFVGGRFRTAGGVEVNNIARWDGQSWSALGRGTDDQVTALASWDPDADGPARELLIAVGGFRTADGLPAAVVAAWDGAAWTSIGGGLSGEAASVCVFDEDASGPLNPALFVGGSTLSSGAGIVRWNSQAWQPMGGTGIEALVVFDPDGAGPASPRLIAGGTFAPGTSLPIAQYDGAAWTSLSASFSGPVRALAVHQESDDSNPVLFAAGQALRTGFLNGSVLRWDGAAWSGLGAPGFTAISGEVRALATHDPDGPGPARPVLAIGGSQITTRDGQSSRIVVWNGAGFTSPGDILGSSRTVHTLASFGIGSDARSLVVGGTFSTAGNIAAPGIAAYEGSIWRSFDIGLEAPGLLTKVGIADFDGPGPDLPVIVAAGEFDRSGEIPLRHLAAFRHGRWEPMVPYSSVVTQIRALQEYDPDGAGVAPPVLVVVGGGSAIDGSQNWLHAWDGNGWVAIAQPPAPAQISDAVCVHDFDGAGGPRPPALTSIGFDRTVHFLEAGAWSQLAPPFTESPYNAALASLDADGEGPLGTDLYFAGAVTLNSSPAFGVVRWTGTGWAPTATSWTGQAFGFALAHFDPDGPIGPRGKELIAGGSFTSVEGVPAVGLAAWSGLRWTDLAGGEGARALVVADVLGNNDPILAKFTPYPANDGAVRTFRRGEWSALPDLIGSIESAAALPMPDGNDLLVVAGRVTSAGGLPTDGIAIYGCGSLCPADFNADSQVNFLDYLDFAGAFAAEDPRADIDHNGQIDFFDYLEFVAAYARGC